MRRGFLWFFRFRLGLLSFSNNRVTGRRLGGLGILFLCVVFGGGVVTLTLDSSLSFFGGKGLGGCLVAFAYVAARGGYFHLDTVKNRPCHQFAINMDCADGIVIARNRVVNAGRIAIAVDDTNHRNADLVGLGHRDVLAVGINDKQHVGQSTHLLDAAERPVQPVPFTVQAKRFFLGQAADALLGQLILDVA